MMFNHSKLQAKYLETGRFTALIGSLVQEGSCRMKGEKQEKESLTFFTFFFWEWEENWVNFLRGQPFVTKAARERSGGSDFPSCGQSCCLLWWKIQSEWTTNLIRFGSASRRRAQTLWGVRGCLHPHTPTTKVPPVERCFSGFACLITKLWAGSGNYGSNNETNRDKKQIRKRLDWY